MYMSPLNLWWNSINKWRNWKYPADEALIPKPWHPDGDEAFTKTPEARHPDSDTFVNFLVRTGGFDIGTGSTAPGTYYPGLVNGYPLNRANEGDRQFIISKTAGGGKLHVQTGYASSYGATFRYRSSMMVQGNPMQGYSDSKLHIFDPFGPFGPTITEIQNFYDYRNGSLRCDGATQYRLDLPSWEARGRSAARMALAERTLRYDDVVGRGWVQQASAGIVGGSAGFIPPALGSDGGSTAAPDAPPCGAIMRLKESTRQRLTAQGYGRTLYPQANAVMDCYSGPGIMIVDLGGKNGTNLEPDSRWNQKDLAALNLLTADDFEFWTQFSSDTYLDIYKDGYG